MHMWCAESIPLNAVFLTELRAIVVPMEEQAIQHSCRDSESARQASALLGCRLQLMEERESFSLEGMATSRLSMFHWMTPDPWSLPEIFYDVDFWWQMCYCGETSYTHCKLLLC